MKMRFIGQHTGGRTSITMGEYTFDGRDPVEVDISTDMGRRLFFNTDFEVVSSGPREAPVDRHLLARAKGHIEACKAELTRRNWEGPDLAKKQDALSAAELRLASLISPFDHDGDGEPGGSLPGDEATAKRGRPRKVEQ